ncbi:hypothetical protein [Paracoccus siganidrum]|uniref:hypothetical protein n=1 Tax=Paracoccus siganidrum TaxID=1276757 RepID=UPI0011C47281|nr:hypothetical protein [Paracoccus siganidrum]
MLIELGEGHAITLPDHLPRGVRRLLSNRTIRHNGPQRRAFFCGCLRMVWPATKSRQKRLSQYTRVFQSTI